MDSDLKTMETTSNQTTAEELGPLAPQSQPARGVSAPEPVALARRRSLTRRRRHVRRASDRPITAAGTRRDVAILLIGLVLVALLLGGEENFDKLQPALMMMIGFYFGRQ